MYNRRFRTNRPKIIGKTDMTPRWESIREIIHDSNVILEILDARMPELSRNKEIEKMVLNYGDDKKLIFILNKADLVANEQLQREFEKLKKESECFILSSKDKIGTKRLREYLLSLGKNCESDYLRIGVVGYPNTGKSSVINALILRHKVKVSSTAGTTHGEQWINAQGNLSIIDSPGVIPLDEHDEVRLALIAAKNVEKIHNLGLVANAIINLFDESENLKKYYKIDELKIKNNCVQDIFEEIGRKKGFFKRGGMIDEGRTAVQIIRDWQTGKLKL